MVYHACEVITIFDPKTKRIRLRPTGENVPLFWVRCSRKLRDKFSIGSTFVMDLKLISSTNRKPYFLSLSQDFSQLSLF